MLFGYPVTALEVNWVHDALVRAVQRVHALVDQGKRLPAWHKLFPVERQTQLKPKHGFKRRIEDYYAALRGLIPAERASVASAIRAQNDMRGLLDGTSSCARVEDLPEPVRAPAQNLFEFAFNLLKALDVRDAQYKIIYDAIPMKKCPFCGIETLSAPGGLREALDHYLARSIYPFAAANLENLPPMGRACNSIKSEKDVLLGPLGRRRAFYPWADRRLRVYFTDSIAFGGEKGRPAWSVAFDPASDEVETWNEIFDVRARYTRELNAHYTAWVTSFAQRMARRVTNDQLSDAVIMDGLDKYCQELAIEGLIGIDALRLPVFEWVLHACRGGNARLLRILHDQVSGEIRRPRPS